jgi:hypothetical protein
MGVSLMGGGLKMLPENVDKKQELDDVWLLTILLKDGTQIKLAPIVTDRGLWYLSIPTYVEYD